ncbi:MAG: PAQR family membrane homeostasis protein TrhA [Beutenbergiaceae bacterium]
MATSEPHHQAEGVAHRAAHAAADVAGSLQDVGENVSERLGAAAAVLKPKLRGWIHAGLAPLALAYGIVLVALTPSGAPRWSTVVFALATVLLFGTSAIYHRGSWGPRTSAVLRRLDHSNIFLVIAGTYTPLAVLLLPPQTARLLLIVIWSGAAAGIAMRVFWLSAPRWLYVPIYLALGWVALAFLPAFAQSGGPAVMWLVIAGGLAYTIGAVIYGLKRPDPSPRWFGFHELFHTGTLAGYAAHAVAVGIAAFSLR